MNRVDGGAARRIAEALGASDDHDLARLFAARRISPASAPASTWRDFFDAAESLLQPEAIAAAVAGLPRAELAALTHGDPIRLLGLTDAEGRAIAPVAAAIGDAEIDAAPAQDPRPASDDAAARAAERAFTTVTAIGDIAIGALTAPLARVGTGALAAGDRRRLVDEQIVREGEADLVVRLAVVTGVLRSEGRAIGTTPDGSAWVQLSTPERWARLAGSLRDALPAGLRDGAGWIDPALWAGAYPLDPAWPAAAAEWTALADLLGLIASDGEPAWAEPLRRGDAPDPALLAALLPSEVDRLYLQNDLSAISPGPLAPALDVRLRTMAVRESHAQASTYRFTEASLAAAVGRGETAESMREFLTGLSLSGLPQPLGYLIDRVADRYGLVRVGTDPALGHTIVTSPAPDVLRTLAVDQALSSLGLVRDGEVLRSRASRDAVYWALSDARYPVVAVDDEGSARTLERGRIVEAQDEHSYDELIARLRAGQGPDADAAWLERELDAAVRERATIVVEVAMPDGSVRELRLEATGMGGGRMRGLDAAADVERTLPVSLIRSMRRL
ncbi:helicase-associated domain-containing protein [Microbacterium indicum]|uniref:helicase-associated domain-containing protein n=1 Tax=Microbacterium indicum TaxID=358100 RepID=UPI00040BB37B|nr:helicase-associated domain-containing protein [Microbacterium indicum]